jgi:threonine dehydratase
MTATVDLVDIRRAADRVAGIAVTTPIITSAWLNRRTGTQALLKAENAQRSGAFKFRGAVNAMLALPPARLAHGVVAGSSGNHGHGVALAARLLGTTAVAVMPRDAPASKNEAVRRLGTRIVSYDRFTEDRDLIVERIAREERRTVIPSAADPRVIAAAGTIVMEMVGECVTLTCLWRRSGAAAWSLAAQWPPSRCAARCA